MVFNKKLFVLGLLLLAGFAKAEDIGAAKTTAGLQIRCADDLTLSLRGSSNFGTQLLEQIREYFPYTYKSRGVSGYEGAAGFEVAVGKMGSIEITGGGDIYMRVRLENDSTITKNFFETSPAGTLNFSLPFAGGFKVQVLNRLERRNFRGPGAAISKFRYTAQTRITCVPLTGWKIAPFVYYEGYTQQKANYLAGFGYGATIVPFANLRICLSDRVLWYPVLSNEVVHQAALELIGDLDFVGKK